MTTFGPAYVRVLDGARVAKQMDVIRDVMLSASESKTWLTLEELHKLTGYPTPSISAQFRHLQRPENGGYIGEKRRRGEGKRGLWEYSLRKPEFKERSLFP
jgi:hypothetical protein